MKLSYVYVRFTGTSHYALHFAKNPAELKTRSVNVNQGPGGLLNRGRECPEAESQEVSMI